MATQTTIPGPRGPHTDRTRSTSAFLDPMLRAYVHEYAKRQRESDAKATEASNKWEARKAWLIAYMERNSHLYKTDTAKRNKVSNDYELNDAMDAWSWHAREAARCHDAIETALRMAELSERYPMPPQRRP